MAVERQKNMKGRIELKYDAQDSELVFKEQLTKTIYDFRLKNKALAEITRPGQFVQVLVPGKTLRRPISVCDVNDDCIRLVFEVKGEGTEIMSRMKVGDIVNIIAPLGTTFDIEPDRKTVFVGGGIGVPPMLFASKALGNNAVVINGFRNKDAVILSEDFKNNGAELIVTTDDGSFGHAGFCTALAEERLAHGCVADGAPYDYLAVCGPEPLMKIVSAMGLDAGIETEVSLERRMACGIGACLSCVVDTRSGKKRSCVDGPVFNASEVVW